MDSTGTGFGNQGNSSKSKTAIPIICITDLGFTDENIDKTSDVEESDEVNSNRNHNPSNDVNISLDKSMGLGRNSVKILDDR